MKELAMNVNEKLIIDILRSFIYNEGVVIPRDVDWGTIVHLAKINSISAIVWYVLSISGIDAVPDNVKQSLFKEYNCTLTMSINRDEHMKRLIEVLNSNGIDHLLFKGYVVKDLYTIPELRTFGDIDFAIRLDDRKKCDTLMRHQGYQLEADWEPVYSYKDGLEYYEVHTEIIDSNLNNKCDYIAYFRDFWQHALRIDQNTFSLSPEYHLIFLLMHIVKHLYGSGAGIRMYLDIAFYINKYRNQIDWKHFSQEIEQLKISKFFNIAFCAVEKWFGIESPIALKETDDEFSNQFLTFTLKGGVFGFDDKPASLSLLRKNTDEKGVRRLKAFLSRAFPSAKTIEVRYTYLQNKHWLLPVAWVHRLYNKDRSVAEYVRSSKELFLTDKDDIVKLQKIYNYLEI